MNKSIRIALFGLTLFIAVLLPQSDGKRSEQNRGDGEKSSIQRHQDFLTSEKKMHTNPTTSAMRLAGMPTKAGNNPKTIIAMPVLLKVCNTV